jgi:hypothetical protein
MKAVWQLFEFEVHGENSSVMHLAINLLNQQPIYFNDTIFIAAVHQQMNEAQFTLMIFLTTMLTI